MVPTADFSQSVAVRSGPRCGAVLHNMYSSWLSWLSRGGAYPVPPQVALPLSLQSLPDVVVTVAEPHTGSCTPHQFTAHRAVLAANSGYFKVALGHDTSPPPCVTVNGVKPEVFAHLLSYMYTGYLDLGSDNIYDMSMATTILHMPRAVELCRNFLCSPGQGTRTTLVKPIPGMPMPWRGPPQPPAQHMVLPTAEHSPFRAPLLAASPAATSPSARGASPAATSPGPSCSSPTAAAPQPAPRPDDRDEQHNQCSPSRSGRLPSPAPAAAEAASPETTTEPTTTTTSADSKRQSPAPPSASASAPAQTPTRGTSTHIATSTSSKVVIDVACCDGPVRFLRVLNERYGMEDNADGTAATASEQTADENQLHQPMNVPGAAQLRRARVAKLSDGQAGAPADSEYRCPYCNHTFKSHYCYQKHARRHLNPLTPKLGTLEGSTSTSASSAAASSSRTTPRAPARPLDMNVQYYPCKTCGSKFPSYYFVHKHRKMCHSGEEAEATAVKTD